MLNPLYAKSIIFEPFLAQPPLFPSYVSFEKALEYHGLIPEGVPVVKSLTTKLIRQFDTKIGTFRYYHQTGKELTKTWKISWDGRATDLLSAKKISSISKNHNPRYPDKANDNNISIHLIANPHGIFQNASLPRIWRGRIVA